MANATGKVAAGLVRWGDDRIIRVLATTAQTYYSGVMLARDASGNATWATDTSGLSFDGINMEANPIIVPSGSTLGDYSIPIGRPWRFAMAIASATAGDEGKAVYVVDNQTVGYSSSNSILVGWVDQVLSSTVVLINPIYGPLTNLSVAANTLTFTGTTGANTIVFPDNLANGLAIEQGSNVYTKYTSTDGSEVALYGAPAATGVTNGGGAVQVIAGTGGTTSGTGGSVVTAGGAGGAGATVGTGGLVSSTGGASTGSGAGGAASAVGGAGGLTGAGGAARLTGGAGGSTSGTGGVAAVAGGAGAGTSATGGAASVTGGASAGASGTAGAASIDAGAANSGTGATVNISDVNSLGTYINRGPLKALQVGLTLSGLGTNQSSTPTSAQLLGGILTQTGATGAGTVTLPTGTALSTACARTPVVGDTFDCYFYNLGGSNTLTITGATGTTVIGTAAVGTGKMAQLKFYNSGSNTWNIYCIVSA